MNYKIIEEKAEKWYDDMSQEEWDNIERKYGYYGHDIGTTEQDVVDLYKMELKNNKILQRELKIERILTY